jgi:hypothetical protein
MKETIKIIAIGFFFLWIIFIPAIFIIKIKYFKISRQKEYHGVEDMLSFFSREWWIAGFTLMFPILFKDRLKELDLIRRKANFRLYFFYLIVLVQLILVILFQ